MDHDELMVWRESLQHLPSPPSAKWCEGLPPMFPALKGSAIRLQVISTS
jgi:hypothetical protein